MVYQRLLLQGNWSVLPVVCTMGNGEFQDQGNWERAILRREPVMGNWGTNSVVN